MVEQEEVEDKMEGIGGVGSDGVGGGCRSGSKGGDRKDGEVTVVEGEMKCEQSY